MTMQDRLLDEWLRGLKWSLTAVPSPEREEIVEETRGHIAERLDGGASLEEVLDAFGPPDAYARRFVDEMEVQSALGAGRSGGLLGGVLRRAHRSVAAVLALAGLLVCCAAQLAAVSLLWMKITDPVHAGLWMNDHGTQFIGVIDDPATAQEMLGVWIYPIGLAVIAISWAIGRFILIATVRTFRPR